MFSSLGRPDKLRRTSARGSQKYSHMLNRKHISTAVIHNEQWCVYCHNEHLSAFMRWKTWRETLKYITTISKIWFYTPYQYRQMDERNAPQNEHNYIKSAQVLQRSTTAHKVVRDCRALVCRPSSPWGKTISRCLPPQHNVQNVENHPCLEEDSKEQSYSLKGQRPRAL